MKARDVGKGALSLAFAGNRGIAVKCLRILLNSGVTPRVILVPPRETSTDAARITEMCSGIPVLEGADFREEAGIAFLRSLDLDYIVSVHFPYLFPPAVLELPSIGTLNIHPAFLPFNRGWHTPSWAILEGTPFGATLHWVDEGIDTGDIALQKRLEIQPQDTADSLYRKVLELEVELFTEAVPLLLSRQLPRLPQPEGGSFHRRRELAARQDLSTYGVMKPLDCVNILRALSTSDPREAAYFHVGGRRYMVRVEISEQPPGETAGFLTASQHSPGHQEGLDE